MGNLLDEIKVASHAQGVAQGVAQGAVATLRDLVARGLVTVDIARAEVRQLVAQGVLSESQGREAIERLG